MSRPPSYYLHELLQPNRHGDIRMEMSHAMMGEIADLSPSQRAEELQQKAQPSKGGR